MKIDDTFIEKGQSTVVKIPVGQLPSGTPISLNAFVFRSVNPGPVALVQGGVHGDEINGVEIVRRVLQEKWFDNLNAGSVIVIPLVNIFGFINFSRDVPDGKDVNRSFPGVANGSLASRVAFNISKKIIPLIDFAIDFHTGGKSLFNYPQVRIAPHHEPSRTLADAFGAPVTVATKLISKSLRKFGIENGKPILVFEGGESTRLDGFVIKKGMDGIRNVLTAKGMMEGNSMPAKNLFFEKSTWQRAPRSGIFVWTKSAGAYVNKKEVIGTLGDPYGQKTIPIQAKQSGFIIGHNNAPVVNQGDALFNIAYSS
ncbi:MAG: succinylglutamate desuccinylase/aspartoacylase family protein [Saprospiraceae bacterium]|nr:succinylglutamate desuccinylase/aspartoacylase family protein [Saprospiraceae bacterium]